MRWTVLYRCEACGWEIEHREVRAQQEVASHEEIPGHLVMAYEVQVP